MKVKFTLSQPDNLIEGKEYLMKEKTDADQVQVLVPVIFVNYEPCSAFVIVSNGKGKQRCSRDDLFLMLPGIS